MYRNTVMVTGAPGLICLMRDKKTGVSGPAQVDHCNSNCSNCSNCFITFTILICFSELLKMSE